MDNLVAGLCDHSCAPLWNSSYKPATTHRLKKCVVHLNSQALFCVCWEDNLCDLVLSNNSAQIFQSTKLVKGNAVFFINWRFSICMYFRLHESCAQFIIYISCALSVCAFCGEFSPLDPLD